MAVTLRQNFGPLEKLPLTSQSLMRQLGEAQRLRILRRTMAGLDVNRAAFEPYSDAYAKAKREALGVDTSKVTLQVSGEMLNAMQILEVTETKVTLGFSR